MRKYFLSCLLLSYWHSPLLSAASQIYKCTNDSGAVTFNDSGCSGSAMQDTHDLRSPMTIPALPSSVIKHTGSTQKKVVRVTVVADNNHPCGVFDQTQRRTHLVRKQVKSGMSQTEVESMFGKPLSQR